MKRPILAPYAFCLAAAAFLAWFELHTDDTGLEVIYILAVTFALGCWRPRNAWQWALLVGPWAPAADILRAILGGPTGIPIHGGLASVAIAVVVVGLIGSYAGALLRKGIRTAAGNAGTS